MHDVADGEFLEDFLDHFGVVGCLAVDPDLEEVLGGRNVVLEIFDVEGIHNF